LFVQKQIELSLIPCFLALFLSAYSLVYCANEYERILNGNIVSGAALAAASSPLGVVTGAIAGHGVATVLAVLGGSFLGTYISEKVNSPLLLILHSVFHSLLICAL
jgi:hypothetical protein